MDEINTLIVQSTAVSLTASLLCELMKRNIKVIFCDERLAQIYAHCRSEQVGLLLIEDGKRRQLLSCEKAVIITEDLCEILENYEEIC